jgi:hypothetical protein
MSTATYAAAKGRAVPLPTARKPTAAPIANEAERERIAGNYALVKEHLPEIVPFIKELHAVGLIDGLRAIQNVQIIQGKEP